MWLRAIGAFLLFFVMQFLVVPLLVQGVVVAHDVTTLAWWSVAAIILIAGSLALYTLYFWPAIGLLFEKAVCWQEIKAGIFACGFAYPITFLWGLMMTWWLQEKMGYALVEQVAVRQVRSSLEEPLLFSVTALLIILVVPLLEEVLFRGFLQTALSAFCAPFWTFVCTAGCFAFLHFSDSQGINNFIILPSLFFLGILLSFLRQKRGNLIAPWALHASFNALSILMIVLFDG